MTILSVKARFACDGCGEKFSVDLDPAYRPPTHWSIDDVAVDCVRGAVGVELDKASDCTGLTSVQGDKQVLCPRCTHIVDTYVTEDRNATADEIERALNAAEETRP